MVVEMPVVSPAARRLLPSRVSSLALRVSSLALHGVLQDVFCNGVVSSDVAKPGELTSFHCCQQGLLLSGKRVHLLSHIFLCLVFSLRNTEESRGAFGFKCL